MKTKLNSFSNSGFTLFELLVSLGLASILFMGLFTQYSDSVGLSHDQNVKIAANLHAQSILQTIGAEIRVLGNGVPFDQENFDMEDIFTLSDPVVTQPIIIATATATNLSFRLNETGDIYMLTQDFDPVSSLNIYLTSVANLAIGDPIYVSNSVVAGDDGFYGEITAVNAASNFVTVDGATYVTPAGATFDTGSIFEEVPIVTYLSPADGGGITRNSGFGSVSLGTNSTLSFDYLDSNGNSLTLPLTVDMVINQLRAIKVTVVVESVANLKSGAKYNSSAEQIFGIRNLNYLY